MASTTPQPRFDEYERLMRYADSLRSEVFPAQLAEVSWIFYSFCLAGAALYNRYEAGANPKGSGFVLALLTLGSSYVVWRQHATVRDAKARAANARDELERFRAANKMQ